MIRPERMPPDVARAAYVLNMVTSIGAAFMLALLALLYAVVPSPWLGALAGLCIWSGAAALTYCQRYRRHTKRGIQA